MTGQLHSYSNAIQSFIYCVQKKDLSRLQELVKPTKDHHYPPVFFHSYIIFEFSLNCLCFLNLKKLLCKKCKPSKSRHTKTANLMRISIGKVKTLKE